MYGDPTTTPGGKALKFYSSVRCQVSKVGGTMEKDGNDNVIGHKIRVKCVKNKTAPPFRKAEFMIYYDGRELNKVQELADVLLTNGMIPRYKADGTLDEKGRNYRFEYEDETLEAKKRDDVYPALEKCPKIQEYFMNKLKAGETEAVCYDKDEDDEDDIYNMSEEDFLASLEDEEANSVSNNNEAEETETIETE